MPLSWRASVVCLAALAAVACSDNFGIDPLPVRDSPAAYPPPTSPENLVSALEVVYNDKVRTAAERLESFSSLFAPSFAFHYWEARGDSLVERTWGLEEEIEGTRCLFERQDTGAIYSLTLAIREKEVREPDGGYPAGWKELRAGRVDLRLLYNPDDGLVLNGGSTRFICAPSGGRWLITGWFDPAEPTRASTWAMVKRCPRSEER